MPTNEHNNPPSGTEEDLSVVKQEPIIFVSVQPPSIDRQWYAQVDLPHGSNYYGGWKEDRLLSVSAIRRALAGASQDYQIGTFHVELADDDYAIREILTNSYGQFYSRWEIDAYMATPSGMRSNDTALHLATGLVDTDPEFDTREDGMTVRMACRDRLGVSMGWTNTGQTKLPRRAVNQTTLPGVGAAMNGKAAWLPWGVLSNNVIVPSGMLPPYPNIIAARGGYFDGAYAVAGYAPWDQTVPPVTGLSFTTDNSGGDCPERDYAIAVIPAMNDGRVGDPTPYVYGDVTTTVTAPDQTLQVSWSGTADRYFVVLFANYFGWRPQQFIETTGLSCSFDHAFDTPDPGTGVATGASVNLGFNIAYYKARAKINTFASAYHTVVDPDLPDFTSPNAPAISVVAFGVPHVGQYRFRPTRMWWTPSTTPGITEYEISKTGPGDGSGGLRFSVVPSSIEDGLLYWDDDWNDSEAIVDVTPDRLQGRIKAVYTRDVVGITSGDTWRELFIAGVPIKGVDDWYYDPGGDPEDVEINQGDGTDFLFPKDGTAWDSIVPTRYRDITGADGITRRYTVGYAKGVKGDLIASGTSIITLNVQGIEDVGDCSGTVITDLHDQLVHFLNYFVLASGEGYTSGLWASQPTPTQGYDNIPVVNTASFDAVKAMRMNEIGGGIVGAGVTGALGEFVDVAEELKRWMVSGDFRLGPNRNWQIVCHAIDTSLSPLFITNTLTDEDNIHDRTFKPTPRLGEMQNIFRYRNTRDYVEGGWLVDNQDYTDTESIANWDIRKQGEDFNFAYIEDASVVGHIFGKQTARRVNAPMYATLEGGMELQTEEFDIGNYFNIKHWRGVGVGGWTLRPMWILAQTFNPQTKRVMLECLDVTDIISDNTPLLEGLMDIQLGGSWYHAPTVTTNPETVDAYEYWDMRFPWTDFPSGTTLTARIWGMPASGSTIQCHLYDPDAAAIIATDPTPFTNPTDFELHTFTLPTSSADKTYRLRAVVISGEGLNGKFKGMIRPNLP